MPRTRPADRLERLIDTAARVFTEKGYRRTQMADVARAMGVAPGTLYLYVESKEALFDLVVQTAFADARVVPAELPLRTPKPEDTLEHLRARAREEGVFPRLDAALARSRVRDAEEELTGIVRELYANLTRWRRAVKLMERSALDWPELAAVWFGEIRLETIRKLRDYLGARMRQGKLRPARSLEATARIVLETVAWSAVHRPTDATPPAVAESEIEDAVVEFVVGGLVKRE